VGPGAVIEDAWLGEIGLPADTRARHPPLAQPSRFGHPLQNWRLRCSEEFGQSKRGRMFDELEKQIRQYEDETTTPKQRRLQGAVVIVLSVVLFGGLYAVIRFVEF